MGPTRRDDSCRFLSGLQSSSKSDFRYHTPRCTFPLLVAKGFNFEKSGTVIEDFERSLIIICWCCCVWRFGGSWRFWWFELSSKFSKSSKCFLRIIIVLETFRILKILKNTRFVKFQNLVRPGKWACAAWPLILVVESMHQHQRSRSQSFIRRYREFRGLMFLVEKFSVYGVLLSINLCSNFESFDDSVDFDGLIVFRIFMMLRVSRILKEARKSVMF